MLAGNDARQASTEVTGTASPRTLKMPGQMLRPRTPPERSVCKINFGGENGGSEV